MLLDSGFLLGGLQPDLRLARIKRPVLIDEILGASAIRNEAERKREANELIFTDDLRGAATVRVAVLASCG